jgi:membrane protein YdbS with pleckstrin-like domain
VSTDAGTPFDPPGLVWTPISSRLVTVRLIGLGISVLLVALGLLVAAALAGQWWLWAGLVAWLALGAVSAFLVPRQVRSWGYAEREDDLLIKHGVMAKSLVVVPYGRMQYVDVQAGPVDRMFDLAKVQLHTASAGSDASIPGLPPEEASRLRDRLASRGESRLAGL